MAAALAGVSLPSTARAASVKCHTPKHQPARRGALLLPRRAVSRRLLAAGPARSTASTPPDLSEKVKESIKKAEETCAGDEVTGECAAAWDEVEELSAAASHARQKLKANSDPLENYCKDNPEVDECRTYED